LQYFAAICPRFQLVDGEFTCDGIREWVDAVEQNRTAADHFCETCRSVGK